MELPKLKKTATEHSQEWKDHVHEFLVLFLAVTLGFFIEFITERFLENHREEEFMAMLYTDLGLDSIQINNNLMDNECADCNLRKLSGVLTSDHLIDQYNDSIYYYQRFMVFNTIFIPESATYDQLKSSGSLRYMQNCTLYTMLTEYYKTAERYRLMTQTNFGTINNYTDIEARLFDANDLTTLYNPSGSSLDDKIQRPIRKLTKIKHDPDAINALHIKSQNARLSISQSIHWLRSLQSQIAKLRSSIVVEYHLTHNPFNHVH